MGLRLHGEALVGRITGRSVGNGPAAQNAVDLQAQIVVKPPGRMQMNDEMPRPPQTTGEWLGGRVRSALPPVLC